MERIKKSAQRFHVLADPIRLQILLLLQEQEMCVGHLAEVLGVNQPTVSYHLKRLHRAGLVGRRTENTWCYYSLCTDLRSWVNDEIDLLLKVEPTA
ncbi:MAG TPA: helix-turn-helix transcriptional regulator [Firmicutes bacterium]|jgi:ArsR family transcriptional regulator|nr:helix-turn-helix transcriptional regulator [Bacillota bacterium]